MMRLLYLILLVPAVDGTLQALLYEQRGFWFNVLQGTMTGLCWLLVVTVAIVPGLRPEPTTMLIVVTIGGCIGGFAQAIREEQARHRNTTLP